MKKNIFLFSALGSLIIGASAYASLAISSIKRADAFSSRAIVAPTDVEEYDAWLNSWSQPDHIYVHYNRGDKNDYDDYCFWIWNDGTQTDGTLWAYNGLTSYTSIDLYPMTTHWMYEGDIKSGESDEVVYKDKYGVIVDVDLKDPNLKEGKVKKGTTPKAASYDDPYCDDLGFLFPRIDSMDGSTHWASDGNKNNDIYDWREESNWRDVEGGQALHIFLSSGSLDEWSYFAGSGIPQVKENPISKDTTGDYRSQTETIVDKYIDKVSPTSKSFKDLGVGYQIFIASFRDSDGDGYGDLRGIIDSLDYLDDLGVDVIWLTPVQSSGSYHSYDIIDYYAVNKKYGTIEDYRELIFKAHAKGMKVLMDLVLNHTSKNNTWFKKSEWGVNSGIPGTENDDTGINWRNVYTWKYATDQILTARKTEDGKDIKQPVEYYLESVEENASHNGESWYKTEGGYYYYGKFGADMPEINYENKETRKLVQDMAKYWLSFGLDGFRLDAVKHIYMKDEVDNTGDDIILTDVGSKSAYDEQNEEYIDKPYDYSSDLTKNIAFWKEFAIELKRVFPDCFLVGENFDGYGTRTAGYYQALDSQFDFSNYYHGADIYGKDAGSTYNYCDKRYSENFGPYSATSDQSIALDPYTVPGGKREDFIDGAFTSNHDVMRAINNINATDKVTGGYDEIGKAKIAGALALLNPGLSWIYYGDEIGMSSNTDQHIALYGNENCMDTWYRQPFIWQGEKGNSLRAHYVNGKYQFTTEAYDSWNSSLLDNNLGITVKADGTFSSTNEIYDFYKKVSALKGAYPSAAKVSYTQAGAVMELTVTGNNAKTIKVYINTGLDSGWIVNPGFSYKEIAHIGCNNLSDFGTTKYSVVAVQQL